MSPTPHVDRIKDAMQSAHACGAKVATVPIADLERLFATLEAALHIVIHEADRVRP